jgi:hypothetical protein
VLFAEGKSVDQALRDYFTAVATCFTSKDTPAGCFMINTSAALAASSTDIANTIKSRHAMQEQTLTQFLQQRQLRANCPRAAMCDSWRSSQLRVARDVDQRPRRRRFHKLMQIADTTLRLWPQVLEPNRASGGIRRRIRLLLIYPHI